ncbi:GNAT family N-acetyltransferase [Actinokineospora bangkokensis]|uniref:GNAT family N-acetyltransferase n=1 Tax=Actinokineospora bangkokensis TaxID=1193682 RepID=A0A1Q9LEE2_9PSEU|nr:GNAT family N-acetyltransferase [Actinokineospora bangkokensis]OLR90396.1 GNAT family N-acetyltransferase [Actinokineospora bangkokensis]
MSGAVRRVRESDVDAVVALEHELAAYQRAADRCELTAEQLHRALFGADPALFGHVVEVGGEVVGSALWFLSFSTWRGEHGIYLEHLIVRAGHRGGGLGRALLAALAAECVARGYPRLEWAVMDWNEPSIGFYRSLGGEPLGGQTVYRLAGGALAALGGGQGGGVTRPTSG